MIVCLEGINGTGKTTLATALARLWRDEGLGDASLADPLQATGYTRHLRDAVMTASDLSPHAEALAFASARLHAAATLRNSARTRLLVVERWAGAIAAYGAAAGTSPDLLQLLEGALTAALPIACTLLLNTPAKVASARLARRGGFNRFESQGSGYLEAVRREYLGWATARKVPILDATTPPAILADAAFSIIRSTPGTASYGGNSVKYTEVEQKYALPDPQALIDRLAELGAQPMGEGRQVDTYFNAPHRDFLAGDVVSDWLRLRSETADGRQAARHSINFKQWLPAGAADATHCDEFESSLGDSEAVRRLLQALGFTEMVTVDKLRRQWRLGEVIIAVDTVEGLGAFAEFEYAGNGATVEQATSTLRGAIGEIGVELGERDHRGYPYQRLKRER
jgi:adenylate cyclase class 2